MEGIKLGPWWNSVKRSSMKMGDWDCGKPGMGDGTSRGRGVIVGRDDRVRPAVACGRPDGQEVVVDSQTTVRWVRLLDVLVQALVFIRDRLSWAI